ncbi:glycosyltransferase family 39 protein, partial [bacterium]|nr:glycosyltransferase family 39 protein [bacterium]
LEYARPPLYPFFIAVVYAISGHHMLALRLAQAILGALCTVVIYKIADQIFSRQAALVAGLIAVFYPYYVFISGLLYPTLLTAFLLMCVIYAVVLAQRQNPAPFYIAAGIFLSLAGLAVPASLAFTPFLILWLVFLSGTPLKKSIPYALLITVVVLVSLAPWTIYCYQQYGKLVLIDPRMEKHLPVVKSDAESPEYVEYGDGERITKIFKNPGPFLTNMSIEFLHFWSFVPDRVVTRQQTYREEVFKRDKRMVLDNPYTSPLMDWISIMTYGPVFILALAGIFLCGSSWRMASLPLLLLLSQAFAYSFFFTQIRYRLPVEFCLMLFAGCGAVSLWSKLKKVAR